MNLETCEPKEVGIRIPEEDKAKETRGQIKCPTRKQQNRKEGKRQN